MADDLRCTVSEVMERMTVRELRVRMKRKADRREKELSEPTPTHFYLMQIARELFDLPYRQAGKTSNRDINSFKLKIERSQRPTAPESAPKTDPKKTQTMADIMKTVWRSRIGPKAFQSAIKEESK